MYVSSVASNRGIEHFLGLRTQTFVNIRGHSKLCRGIHSAVLEGTLKAALFAHELKTPMSLVVWIMLLLHDEATNLSVN